MSNQKNSFIDLLEQVALLNKNSTEILTKMNDAVSTQADSLAVKYINPDGTTSTYNVQTVGYLSNQIKQANDNINRLAGLEGTSIVFQGGTSKKIYTVDLNREPYPIDNVGSVTKFNAQRNWFFESLMNPLISVNFNLADKISDNVTKVMSRRYIVRFEKTDVNTLSANGQASLTDFNNKFLGRSDIQMSEFLAWYANPSNLGVENGANPNLSMDEQTFDLNVRYLQYHGTFSVLKTETDSLNKKIWYHLNSLNYYAVDGTAKSLAKDDQLILYNRTSSTRYKIREVSTANSLFRVDLEIIEGYDPIPIGENVLAYYSTLQADLNINVSVGYDERNVIFVKPINTDNNVAASMFSKGTAFYTNDLVLDTNSNVKFADYYTQTVNDYGSLLKDLVTRMIPTSDGVVPNKPVLDLSNFKVVQTNKHLTNTQQVLDVKQLNSLREQYKGEIDALNAANIAINTELATKQVSPMRKSTLYQDLSTNAGLLQIATTNLASTVSKILNSNVDPNVEPEFSVRGFFPIPDPIENQHVIQFIYQYRYSAVQGDVAATDGFTTVNGTGQTETGFFSNWYEERTLLRKRTYDVNTDTWTWNTEDIGNSNTPNVNQLDIRLHSNEQVEIRMRSVSEVGFPDAEILSDWSDSIIVVFPTELSNTTLSLAEQNIVELAFKDQAVLEMQQSLNNLGYSTHVANSFSVNQVYYAHRDKDVSTSFTDANGVNIDLYTYLNSLTTRIKALEEIVSKAKGELKVYLSYKGQDTELAPGSSLPVLVECENYGVAAASSSYRTYNNEIYVIKDYSLKLQNVSAANPLGLLADRLYTINSDNSFYQYPNHEAVFVDDHDQMYLQKDQQCIWFSDNINITHIYGGVSGNSWSNANATIPVLNSANYNLGYVSGSGTLANIVSGVMWSGGTASNAGSFLGTVHPMIKDPNSIIDTSSSKMKTIKASENMIIPINIYFRFDNSYNTTYSIPIFNRANNIIERNVKIFVEVDGQSREYQYTITFRLRQHLTAFFVLP